jgi:hypothetical protein
MNSSQKNRVRLSVEALERRDVPATLTMSPPAWIELGPQPIVKEITASAGPGLATAELHSGGVVPWSPAGAQVSAVELGAGNAHARPFHAKDTGNVVINGDLGIGTTIEASASGQATHLGAFTLHDTSTVVGADGAIRYIEGGADLEMKNGDHLCASFTGTVDLATFTATVTFEWTGGTGRFADATGTTVWHISLNPDLTYTAVADGVIRY